MPVRIGVSLKAEDNPFWSVEVRRGVEIGAHNNSGIQIVYQSPQSIADVWQQKRILKSFIRQKLDAIVLAPNDPVRIAPIVQRINRAGIPLCVIDTPIASEQVAKRKLTYHFIGFDDEQGGIETGKILCDRLPRGARVAIIEGPTTGSFTARVAGFTRAVSPHLTIVERCSANFEEDAAYKKTIELLDRHPDLQGIFCTSDNMAMGALTALYECGADSVLVCGFDATHAGLLAVRQGKLLSTIDTHPDVLGQKAIAAVMQRVQGNAAPQNEQYFVTPITQESIAQVPKRFIQHRTYNIIEPKVDGTEYPYGALRDAIECPIVVGDNLLQDLPLRLTQLQADKFIFISDYTVEQLYTKHVHSILAQHHACELITFAPGEHMKTFTTLNMLASRVLDCGITKNSVIVIVGGGVVGNIAGLLASLLMRGIRFVHVPTTVTAQLDSTTGGKQAVNTQHGKNLLGTFYAPEFIYIDTRAIDTLPVRESRSGLAEAVKHGLCQSPDLLRRIMADSPYAELLRKTIELKIELLKYDPGEERQGLALVYGHTVGHALEVASQYALNHGEAISIGMMVAAQVAQELGIADAQVKKDHALVLSHLDLPIRLPKHIQIPKVLSLLAYDKKERTGDVQMVLLQDIGVLYTNAGRYSVPVSLNVIEHALRVF